MGTDFREKKTHSVANFLEFRGKFFEFREAVSLYRETDSLFRFKNLYTSKYPLETFSKKPETEYDGKFMLDNLCRREPEWPYFLFLIAEQTLLKS